MKVKLELNLTSVPETDEDEEFNLYFVISKQYEAEELLQAVADYQSRREEMADSTALENWIQKLREQLENARR